MRPGPACPRNGGARPGPSWSDCHPLLCSPVRELLPRSKQPQVQGLLLLTGMGLAGGSRALHVSHSPPGARGLAGASEADAQPLDPWQEESEASLWEELPTHRQEAWMWGRRPEPGRTLPVPWLSCQFAPSWGGGASVPKHGGVGTPGPREGLLPARGWARGRERPPRSSGCPGRKGGGPLAGRSRGPAGGAWGGDRQQKSEAPSAWRFPGGWGQRRKEGRNWDALRERPRHTGRQVVGGTALKGLFLEEQRGQVTRTGLRAREPIRSHWQDEKASAPWAPWHWGPSTLPGTMF